MALPLTSRDKDLLLSALGLPETRDRVVALLDLAGTGNMTGPASATDNAIARFDGTTGALVQNSGVLVSDSNAVSGVASLNGVAAATIAFLDATSSIQTQLNSKLSNSGGSVGGPLLLANGSVGAPAYSFSSETNSGLYRAGSTDFRFSVSGSDRLMVTSGIFTALVPVQTSAGSAAAPSFSFTADPNTGLYNRGADELGLSTGGSDRLIIQSAAVISTVNFAIQDGAAATPGLYFNNDTNSGLYRIGTDNIALVTNGISGVAISSAQAVTLGTGTGAIHRFNSTLQAPAAGVLTLTNGPGASTGNPAVYLTLNINGTNYAIPAWAF